MLLNTHIPFSYLINKVKAEAVSIAVVVLATHFLTVLFHESTPNISVALPAFIGTAISVILSFKLNQSYDRWWEARKIWGSIVNDSRTFVLQLKSFVGDNALDDVRTMALRQIAWAYSLGQSLRGQPPLNNIDTFLSPQDLESVSRHSNKPLAISLLQTQHLSRLRGKGLIDTVEHVQIDSTLNNLVDAMGMAERIRTTVFPVTYRKFLHWVIYLFTVLLTIALKDIEIYFSLPLLITIGSAFFFLERSATHMQDPFRNAPTDTAMTQIAQTIEINLKQLIGDANVPSPSEPATFYVM